MITLLLNTLNAVLFITLSHEYGRGHHQYTLLRCIEVHMDAG